MSGIYRIKGEKGDKGDKTLRGKKEDKKFGKGSGEGRAGDGGSRRMRGEQGKSNRVRVGRESRREGQGEYGRPDRDFKKCKS